MSLNIKSWVTDALVRNLCEITGENMTKAVTTAVSERLEREKRSAEIRSLIESVRRSDTAPSNEGTNGRSLGEMITALCDEDTGQLKSETSIAEAIDVRRLEIARLEGAHKTIDSISSGLFVAIIWCAVSLLLISCFDRPTSTNAGVLAVLGGGCFVYYWRGISKENAARERLRQSLANEVKALSEFLPDHLAFMSQMPLEWPDTYPLPSDVPQPTETGWQHDS